MNCEYFMKYITKLDIKLGFKKYKCRKVSR